MNKRIKELLNQCSDPELTKPWPLVDSEKFAELIIRECAEIAREDSDRYARFDSNIIMSGKADVLALCSHHIKKHFGIKE